MYEEERTCPTLSVESCRWHEALQDRRLELLTASPNQKSGPLRQLSRSIPIINTVKYTVREHKHTIEAWLHTLTSRRTNNRNSTLLKTTSTFTSRHIRISRSAVIARRSKHTAEEHKVMRIRKARIMALVLSLGSLERLDRWALVKMA